MEAGQAQRVSTYDLTWPELGNGPADSMPIGNGDTGLNVWTEQNGDVCFYIGKTDAWSEANRSPAGLLKLGRVRISLSPNPFTADVKQTLHLYDGQISITGGADHHETTLLIWVDANCPVIRVQCHAATPVSIKTSLEVWRKSQQGMVSPDVILPNLGDRIEWYHHNEKADDPHTKDWTFGAAIKAEGMSKQQDTQLVTPKPVADQLISVYPLTVHPSTPEQWQSALQDSIDKVEAVPLDSAQTRSEQWWHDFWDRSYIFADGDAAARETSRGYALSRYVMGCSERGAYPIKFNGNMFVVDEDWDNKQTGKKTGKVTTIEKSADYRAWGGQYWFQNTRPMYWSRLMAGDFDMMRPLFAMYRDMLPENSALVKQFYNHDGCYFAETAPFYGGIHKLAPDKGAYTDHYFTPILELTAMMLDYYEYTQDEAFAKETLLPIASAGMTFFDQHWKRDEHGKLLLDPDNAIEMFWRVHDPAPDIAGLQYDLRRLLELPGNLVDARQRTAWTRLQGEVPELPTGAVDGRTLLLSYSGQQTQLPHNSENPELYSIYPFRIYGFNKPDLQLAIDTFNSRRIKQTGCWYQDPVQAAYLGLTDLAAKDVHFNLTRSDPHLKFPAFWAVGHDYDPDEDNGGNGENGFQKMLMHCDGKEIVLLPAWPAHWNCDFKLAAPYQTTVSAIVRDGKVVDLKITPDLHQHVVVASH